MFGRSKTRLIADRTIEGVVDRGSSFKHLNVERVVFKDCTLSFVDDPRDRGVVEDVQIKGCSARNVVIGPAVIRRATISLARCERLVQCWGTVFDQVVLTGRFDRVMTSPFFRGSGKGSVAQAKFDVANRQFYSGVSWALDIRGAQFRDLELKGVPARLVRASSENTAVVESKVVGGDLRWDQASIPTLWRVAIRRLLEFGLDDTLLVAGELNPDYQSLRLGLDTLRRLGLAHPPTAAPSPASQ